MKIRNAQSGPAPLPFEGDDRLVRVSGVHEEFTAAWSGHSLLRWFVLLDQRAGRALALAHPEAWGKTGAFLAAETYRSGQALAETVAHSFGKAGRVRFP